MSVSIIELWLPILLGGLLCLIASALIHMLIKYHNSDYKELSNEDEVSDAIGKGSPSPGVYSFPHCADMKEMGDERMQQRFNDGPVAFVTIFQKGMPQMGKLMMQQFAFFTVGCLLIAYVATLSLATTNDYISVFRFVSAVAFLTFGWGLVPYSIWYGHPWSTTIKYLIDALIYALVVAGTFAWLWPN